MLPTRIFRNRWHALLFAGVVCALAAEFASDAPAIRSDRPVEPTGGTTAMTARPASLPPISGAADQGGFAGLFASADSRDTSSPRMLPVDSNGDGIADAMAREVR